MKFRFLFLLVTLASPLWITAQITKIKSFKNDESFLIEESSLRAGVCVFSEDFENGFEGNNGMGEWEVEDNGGDNIWYEGGSGGPSGPLAGVFGPIASSTAENGYAIFDADLFNNGSSQMVTGRITSPSIDMTEMESVLVEYCQSYLYCCVPESPFFLEVSINNGVEWTSFDAHGDFPLVTNEPSPNNMKNTIDISCLAAGESNVKIRFSFNKQENPNISHYFWMIDDICIKENPIQYDLAVNRTTNVDISNSWEFFELPISQTPIIDFGAMVSNLGTENAENAEVIFEVLNENQSEVLYSNSQNFSLVSNPNSLDCPSIKEDTIQSGFGYEEIGTFWIRTTVVFAQDENPENNVSMLKFSINDEEYWSHSEGPFNQILEADFDEDTGLYEGLGVGSYFFPENDAYLQGATVNFGNQTSIEAEFDMVIYLLDESELIANATVFYQEAFQMQEDWIPSGIGEDFVDVDFADCLELSGNSKYFLALIQPEDTNNNIEIKVVEDLDTDSSTRFYQKQSNGEYTWFANQLFTPALKIHFTYCLSVSENETEMNFRIYPNPVVDRFNIDSKKRNFMDHGMIYNMRGQLVMNLSKEELQSNSPIDIGHLKTGIYSFHLCMGEEYEFIKFVKL